MIHALMGRFSKLVCGFMLLAFAVLSYSAALTKNSTYDETLHVPAAYEALRGDYRVNPEHPPLWKYWAALPDLIWPINTSAATDDWKGIAQNFAYEWNWAIHVLYGTPGNDADAIVNRSRFMMTILAMSLGAVLISWANRLGGAMAAMVAGGLYCLDPNFLAHGSLVTNDVAITLCFFAWIWAIWRVGKNASAGRIAVLALLCGMAMMVKFSGMLLAPLTVVMLGIRAGSGAWRVCGKDLLTHAKRFAAAGAICVLAGLVSYVIIWAAYGFRYAATSRQENSLSWPLLIEKTRFTELYSGNPREITETEQESWRPSLGTRCMLLARNYHLLPEALCYGMLYVHASGLVRLSYLVGKISPIGWWYYFPLTILFKTPTVTLAAMMIGLIAVGAMGRHWWKDSEQRWLALTLIIPTACYFVIVIAANLDLGVRHVLEIYPPIYLGIGLLAARARTRGKVIAALFAILLATESISAWPNFIPFFNWPSGGWRGGINLLGDSNLDWGQDLKLLAKWQKSHANQKLYLLYFGTADPAYYGVHYFNLPGSYMLGPPMAPPSSPGIIAASATAMQGIYLDDAEHIAYGWMMHAQPIAVLGGSIYLFDYPYHPPVQH